MSAAVQLSFEADGLDPHELAKLPTPDRGAVYRELQLHPLQVAAAEEAVRAVIAGSYRGRGR
jgi:hypothetical protein